MKEKLYAIPVNDAFNVTSECPVCVMYNQLETNAIDYTMGPSYMEDDIRAQTDESGFCQKHTKMLYDKENRLGMALVLNTHIANTTKKIQELSKNKPKKTSFLSKAPSESPLLDYIQKLNQSCFVCNRIDNVFNRYIDTIFHLYKTDTTFKDKYNSCNGFCTCHYGTLMSKAPSSLSGNTLDTFIDTTNDLYIKNMERVNEDLTWFINKFDHKYANEPWKNSKDSIPRAITKTNSII